MEKVNILDQIKAVLYGRTETYFLKKDKYDDLSLEGLKDVSICVSGYYEFMARNGIAPKPKSITISNKKIQDGTCLHLRNGYFFIDSKQVKFYWSTKQFLLSQLPLFSRKLYFKFNY